MRRYAILIVPFGICVALLVRDHYLWKASDAATLRVQRFSDDCTIVRTQALQLVEVAADRLFVTGMAPNQPDVQTALDLALTLDYGECQAAWADEKQLTYVGYLFRRRQFAAVGARVRLLLAGSDPEVLPTPMPRDEGSQEPFGVLSWSTLRYGDTSRRAQIYTLLDAAVLAWRDAVHAEARNSTLDVTRPEVLVRNLAAIGISITEPPDGRESTWAEALSTWAHAFAVRVDQATDPERDQLLRELVVRNYDYATFQGIVRGFHPPGGDR